MSLHPQCWDISVFLLCKTLVVPLIVSEANPQSSAKASAYLMGGGPAVWKQSMHSSYITVGITKLATTTIIIPY